MDLHFGQ